MAKKSRLVLGDDHDGLRDGQSVASLSVVGQKRQKKQAPTQAEVITILKKHIQEAQDSYDQFAKAQLARARKQIWAQTPNGQTKKERTGQSGSEIVSVSPFIEISEQTDYMPTRSKKKRPFAVSSCTGSSSVSRRAREVEVTRYGDDSVDVPGYTFHVQLQSNIVTENNTKLNFNPNEIQFDDPQWSIEEYEEELKEHFTGGLLEERAKPLRYVAKAKYLRPFMVRALEELGISADIIFQFLAHLSPDSATKQTKPLLIREKAIGSPHNKVKQYGGKEDLMPITKDEQELAKTFCEAFEKLLKFSAWYLVKEDFSNARKDVAASCDNEGRMCRICFRFLCTVHGEFQEEQVRPVKKRKVSHKNTSNSNLRTSIPLQGSKSNQDNQDKNQPDDKRQLQSYKFWRDYLEVYESLNEDLPVNYARGQFYPCNHDGSCKDNNCQCFQAGVNCEKFCGCSKECPRRFRGCDCTRRDIPCSPKSKCVCRMMDRECDPDLCGKCGASFLLEPTKAAKDETPVDCCSNVGIQRGIPKRMLLGTSQVSGFGLFMGEEASEGDFLAEYKGELISKSEAHRRQILHQHLREYLFVLNKDQQIDGLYAGNKLRFINNSCKADNINCDPIPMFCNGVVRMGLFATRALRPGDELFFNYGYTEEQMEDYKELPDKLGTRSKSAGHASWVPDKTNLGTLKGLMAGRKPMTAAPPASRPSPLTARIVADSDDGFEENALDSDSG